MSRQVVRDVRKQVFERGEVCVGGFDDSYDGRGLGGKPESQETLEYKYLFHKVISSTCVGQIVNLRPIDNRPVMIPNSFTDRFPIGRRLATCPTIQQQHSTTLPSPRPAITPL